MNQTSLVGRLTLVVVTAILALLGVAALKDAGAAFGINPRVTKDVLVLASCALTLGLFARLVAAVIHLRTPSPVDNLTLVAAFAYANVLLGTGSLHKISLPMGALPSHVRAAAEVIAQAPVSIFQTLYVVLFFAAFFSAVVACMQILQRGERSMWRQGRLWGADKDKADNFIQA